MKKILMYLVATIALAGCATRQISADQAQPVPTDRVFALGSPPFSRTLTRRPIKAMRSVHVEAKEVQHRVQARCG
ncbi:membrane lipoprotein lipid attachment site-containing protein [Stenotrophomonas maltophilia]|uniref:membrane lipoprotein lipid attachment site-containing protein n=1 Tax=Stenotrophomonas maltophilia TaxID=40324 RepID=UPI0012AFA324|nr:membrane lipoprotein lipid attachment site-containing protein [Stenotrophomonas maltophilia]QGL67002.1 hypothetical protein FEO86_06770 [Stenotrophomonas maltophilia]